VFCLFTLNYIKVLSYSSEVLNYFVINVHIMSRILEIEGNRECTTITRFFVSSIKNKNLT
jgi:hypothetical protein